MAGTVGNKNAKGNKGGGRPSLVNEAVRALVINKSWNRIKNKFLKKNPTQEEKKELDYIAVEIAKKTIPTEVKGDLNGNFIIKWEDK